MKKLVLTLAIVTMAAITAVAQETFEHPAWNCRDVAVLQHQLTLAVEQWHKITMTYMLDFAQNGEPATFSDACTRIEAVINTMEPEMPADRRIEIKKQFAYCCNVFLPELIAYCKANPCSYDLFVAMQDKTEWGYQTATNCLLKYSYSANYVILAIEYLNRQAIALNKPDAEVLDLLKKMNRVFSAKLIEDKEAWGGVVAQIRTMMETYK